MRVKSKVDTWIGVTVWLSLLAVLVSIIALPQNMWLLGIVIGLPIILLLLWIYLGTYYEIKEDHLYCRCGPMVEKIPYKQIKSIKKSKNPLASMALSLERIEIKQHGKRYITGTTFISPEDRDEFLEDLLCKCENLEPDSEEQQAK